MIEYSKSYTTGSLWNYYRDELTDDTNDNDIPNKNVITQSLLNTRQVLYGVLIMLMQKLPMQKVRKLIILFMMEKNLKKKEVEIAAPFLDIPSINCEMSLILTCSRKWEITCMEKRVIIYRRRDTSPTNAKFQITDTKLHVPVATLSTENDKRLLEQLRTGFKKTIKWNKYE